MVHFTKLYKTIEIWYQDETGKDTFKQGSLIYFDRVTERKMVHFRIEGLARNRVTAIFSTYRNIVVRRHS